MSESTGSHEVAAVAVLGLGAMGLPMASRLAQRFRVTGYDVSADRRRLAADAGVEETGTPGAGSAGADVVVVGVRDAAQLDAALFGADGAAETMRPGTVVVLTSTVGAEVAEAVAARLAEHDVAVVDAPVSGGPVRAGTGDLLIMVGSPDEPLARARPVLETLATSVAVAGSAVGDGQRLKTVNQLLCGIHTAAAAEALALAHALGLDLDRTIEVLGQGAAASFMLADRGPRIAQQLTGEQPELRSRLDVIGKDMGIVADLARSQKLPTPVAAAAEQLYRLADANGLAAADDSVIATFLTPPTGTADAGGPSRHHVRQDNAERKR